MDEAEISKLDFRYEHAGIMLGFDKSQILSAVHGVQDSVIISFEYVIIPD